MGQMSICSMSSISIRMSGKIINISAQTRDIYLLQIFENTDIRKSQQELKGWRMCSCTYQTLWTLNWAVKAGSPANIHRTLVYQRHSFRMIFANVTNALRNKALGEVFFIFLCLMRTRWAMAAEPAMLHLVSYDLMVVVYEHKRLALTPLCQAY